MADTSPEEVRPSDGNAPADGREPTGKRRTNLAAHGRWKKLRNSVSFTKRLASNFPRREGFLEDELFSSGQEVDVPSESKVFEDSNEKSLPNSHDVHQSPEVKTEQPNQTFKPRGRAGLKMIRLMQDRSLILFFSDFYVVCLKASPLTFLAGVFSAPLLLGLLFTPFFLLDIEGLQFEERIFENLSQNGEKTIHPIQKACSIYINVFLYALSLSTTFGGSPITPISPYTLLLSNLNTLCSQFLFVFLSGAVFARMAQPSQPIKCSKKAIIRNEDFVFSEGGETSEKFRVFAMRLVLLNPLMCELIDVKINCTLRLFQQVNTIFSKKDEKKEDLNVNSSISNPHQQVSMFVSAHDLPLVRSEIAYLRMGLTCRHIINSDSILYGLSKEDLFERDACFSITIVGTEKTSMQSVFHMQDYYVYDGDVVWDGDFVDLVSMNKNGYRVIDHSKLDMIKTFKVSGIVGQAIVRMAKSSHSNHLASKGDDETDGTSKDLSNLKSKSQLEKASSLLNSDFGKMSTESKDCPFETNEESTTSSTDATSTLSTAGTPRENRDEGDSGNKMLVDNSESVSISSKFKSLANGLHRRVISSSQQ